MVGYPINIGQPVRDRALRPRQARPVTVAAYRHGLVHNFTPKNLKRADGRVLSWMVYDGPRLFTIQNSGSQQPIRHLEIFHESPTVDRLPISIQCLVHDLLSAIDLVGAELLREQASGSNARLTAMQQTAGELAKPDEGTFTW